jgi:hypothetical protein
VAPSALAKDDGARKKSFHRELLVEQGKKMVDQPIELLHGPRVDRGGYGYADVGHHHRDSCVDAPVGVAVVLGNLHAMPAMTKRSGGDGRPNDCLVCSLVMYDYARAD